MREIRINKIKIAFFLLVSLFAFGIGCFIVFIDSNPPPKIYIIGGIGGIVFFGFCSVFFLLKLFDQKPGLTINKDGIIDNTNLNSVGFIRWSDIEIIDVIEGEDYSFFKMYYNQTNYLIILVKNPEQYVTRINKLKKYIFGDSFEEYGVIKISSTILKCSFKELKEIILEDFNNYKKN